MVERLRAVLFRLATPPPEQNGSVSAWYFERLDKVRTDGRSVNFRAARELGRTAGICKLWLCQRGFVVYPVPAEFRERVRRERLESVLRGSASAAMLAAPNAADRKRAMLVAAQSMHERAAVLANYLNGRVMFDSESPDNIFSKRRPGRPE